MIISKKASLQLSINAIVVLVMAMVVLGLGLTFVRGLFGQGGDQLGKTISNNDLKNPASAEIPLTIDNHIKVKLGKSSTLSVGYYNSGSSGEEVFATGAQLATNVIGCYNEDGAQAVFRLSSPGAEVNAGEAAGYEVSVKPLHAGAEIATPANLYDTATQAGLDAYSACVTSGGCGDVVPTGLYVCSIQVGIAGLTGVQSGQFQVTVTG